MFYTSIEKSFLMQIFALANLIQESDANAKGFIFQFSMNDFSFFFYILCTTYTLFFCGKYWLKSYDFWEHKMYILASDFCEKKDGKYVFNARNSCCVKRIFRLLLNGYCVVVK